MSTMRQRYIKEVKYNDLVPYQLPVKTVMVLWIGCRRSVARRFELCWTSSWRTNKLVHAPIEKFPATGSAAAKEAHKT